MNRLMAGIGALCTGAVFAASPVAAHVGVTSPVPAGAHQLLTFTVGHGCEGADTIAVEISIPKSVTSLRALPSPWGDPVITRDDADLVTMVSWTKETVRDRDDLSYQFGLNITVPDAPFSMHYFKTKQTCRDAEGMEYETDWSATQEELAADSELHPSPVVVVVPKHTAGWNQLEVPEDVADMRMFNDAQIVWLGDAAFSPNETTAKMIEEDDSVELLESIPAGSTIWVKY